MTQEIEQLIIVLSVSVIEQKLLFLPGLRFPNIQFSLNSQVIQGSTSSSRRSTFLPGEGNLISLPLLQD